MQLCRKMMKTPSLSHQSVLKPMDCPQGEELLKSLGYQGINIALSDVESDDEYKGILNGIGMFNQGSGKSKPARLKLCNWKLYLASCATYHLVFADWCLNNVHKVEVYLKGHFNI